MLHKLEAHPFLEQAKYIVGVDEDGASRIYFDKPTALANVEKHIRLDFFDKKGMKVGFMGASNLKVNKDLVDEKSLKPSHHLYYSDRPNLAKELDEREWRAAEYKRLRSALNLSQKDLATLTGLSINTINQIPSVKYNRIPSLLVLERMRYSLEHRETM